DHHAALALERIGERPDHLLARRLARGARLVADGFAGDRQLASVQEPGVEQTLGDDPHAAGLVHLGRRVVAPGSHVGQERCLARDLSNSSIASLTPASLAMASRCRTALVEPPVAITPAIALWSALRVMIWRGRRPFVKISITSFPVSKATSSLRGSTAVTPLNPIGDTPSISNAVDIVLAVNWP